MAAKIDYDDIMSNLVNYINTTHLSDLNSGLDIVFDAPDVFVGSPVTAQILDYPCLMITTDGRTSERWELGRQSNISTLKLRGHLYCKHIETSTNDAEKQTRKAISNLESILWSTNVINALTNNVWYVETPDATFGYNQSEGGIIAAAEIGIEIKVKVER